MRPRCEKHRVPRRRHIVVGKAIWLCQYSHRQHHWPQPVRRGCGVCGEELLKHKPNSYYDHIEHAYRR